MEPQDKELCGKRNRIHIKHNIWKDIAIATIPSLIALTLQKLLEEAFDYYKSLREKDKAKCPCELEEQQEDPNDKIKN